MTDHVTDVRASGENTGGGEVKENLVDGVPGTKWLTFASTGWVEFDLDEPVKVVTYALTSANDHAERDPTDWTLQGSTDGTTGWTDLDSRTGESFAERLQTKSYDLSSPAEYRHFRLDIGRNNGGAITQLADVQFSTGGGDTPVPRDMLSLVDRGPSGSPTAKARAGFTGKTGAAVRGHAPGGRTGVLVQQGLRREHGRRPGHRAVVPDLPVDGGRRSRLRRHERVGGPGLHGRHLSE